MDIRDKLNAFESLLSPRPLRPKIAREDNLAHLIPGEEFCNASGACNVVQSEFPISHVHGSITLSSIFEIPPEIYAWVSRDPQFATVDLENLVFIDTETTGLAGGTGTVPFLVGMGWFEGNVFRIQQFFMRDYHEEGTLLSGVKERLAKASGLVSFNGKAFDLYLIKTRFLLSRIKYEITLPHLDLLFTARRIWKHHLADCSLSSLEQKILDFYREEDIPSALIPRLYFDYLRSRNAEILVPIFQHNVWDILSLVGLTSICGKAYAFPEKSLTHPMDLLGIGQAFLTLDRNREAVKCFEKALSLELPTPLRKKALICLGFALKQLGEWEKMLVVWETLIQEVPDYFPAYEEMAKFYEHRSRNIFKAMEIVALALSQINQWPCSWAQTAIRNRFLYRMERLKTKCPPRQWEYMDLFQQEYER